MTEETTRKLTGFLGLCARAGQTTLGQDACVAAVRSEAAAVLLMDEASAPTTRKRFLDSCASHGVPLYGVPEGLIARALGRDGRKTVAVRQGAMARKLLELLTEERPLAGAGEQPDPHSRKSSVNHAGVQAVQ